MKLSMKLRLSIVFLFLFCLTGFGQNRNQTSCELNIDNSPVLRGLKLGQGEDYIVRNFNVVRNSANAGPFKTLSGGSIKADDVTYILRFKQNRLSSVIASYSYSKFRNIDSFVQALNQTLNLPDLWQKPTTAQVEANRNLQKVKIEREMLNSEFESARKNRNIKGSDLQKILAKMGESDDKISSLERDAETGYTLLCKGFYLKAYIRDNFLPQLVISEGELKINSVFKP